MLNDEALFESREDQELELLTCEMDPWHFIREWCFTFTLDGEVHRIPDWEFLMDAVKAVHLNQKVNVLKGRQMLITWILCCYALWLIRFKKRKTVLAISKSKEDANEIVFRMSFIYSYLPAWMRIPLKNKKPSKSRIHLSNGSRAISLSCKPESARSWSPSFVLADEAAWHQDFPGVYQSIMAAVNKGASLAVVSTPNPKKEGKLFRDICRQPEAKGFKQLIFPWHLHPEKDAAWAEEMERSMGSLMFQIEHGCSLAGIGVGQAFSKFGRKSHVIDDGDFALLPSFKKYRVIDFGPHMACLWVAEDPLGNLTVYRELHIRGMPAEVRCDRIVSMSGNEVYEFTLGDNADPQAITDFAKHGVHVIPCLPKNVFESVYIMRRYIEGDGVSTPRLEVLAGCREFISQVEDYMLDENGVPVRHQVDHGVDACRYIVRYLAVRRRLGATRSFGNQVESSERGPMDRTMSRISLGGLGTGDIAKEMGLLGGDIGRELGL